MLAILLSGFSFVALSLNLATMPAPIVIIIEWLCSILWAEYRGYYLPPLLYWLGATLDFSIVIVVSLLHFPLTWLDYNITLHPQSLQFLSPTVPIIEKRLTPPPLPVSAYSCSPPNPPPLQIFSALRLTFLLATETFTICPPHECITTNFLCSFGNWPVIKSYTLC